MSDNNLTVSGVVTDEEEEYEEDEGMDPDERGFSVKAKATGLLLFFHPSSPSLSLPLSRYIALHFGCFYPPLLCLCLCLWLSLSLSFSLLQFLCLRLPIFFCL